MNDKNTPYRPWRIDTQSTNSQGPEQWHELLNQTRAAIAEMQNLREQMDRRLKLGARMLQALDHSRQMLKHQHEHNAKTDARRAAHDKQWDQRLAIVEQNLLSLHEKITHVQKQQFSIDNVPFEKFNDLLRKPDAA